MEGKVALIFGGGTVSERKVKNFLEENANIIVVSKCFTPTLKELGKKENVMLVEADIETEVPSILPLISKANIIIAATDNPKINSYIAEEAKKRRILVCAVDRPSISDFFQPAIARFGSIQIGICTNGKSPIMASVLRKRVEKIITPQDVLHVELQSYARALSKTHISDRRSRRQILYQIFQDPEICRLINENNFEEAKNRAKQIIESSSSLKRDNRVYQIVNLRITYKKAPIKLLEKTVFENPYKVSTKICSFNGVKECVVLQTCNRVEIYAIVKNPEIETEIAEYWRNKIGFDNETFYSLLERTSGSETLFHLLRLSSGLESMMVGEDQILGQVQDAYKKAKNCGTIGPILDTVLIHAIKTGRKVRNHTGINKGAVSIGSAAVVLLENVLGNLNEMEIAIFGAGENATLIGKALKSKKQVNIIVANRTYEKGVSLAKMLEGRAVRFDKIKELLTHIDAAIVATSAPYYIITRELLESILNKRINKRLVIIDLSQPRNVEETIGDLPDITLCNIDDLREIAEENIKTRLEAAKKAEAIVCDEVKQLESLLKRERAERVISAIWFEAEEIRHRELNKALRMLGNIDEEQRKIVEKLTQVIVKRILHTPIEKLRVAAANDDIDTIRKCQLLFNVNLVKGGKMD